MRLQTEKIFMTHTSDEKPHSDYKVNKKKVKVILKG